MKKKIPKILGVALAFMLVASLMAFGAPVAAADYEENDWGEWGLAAIEPDTDVGPIAVAPDGTLYAAVDTTTYPVTLLEVSLDTAVDDIEVTVEDSGTAVTWMIDFPLDDNLGNGSLVAGLVIALDGEGQGPAYQIHPNDGTCPAFPDGTWLYSPYDNGWHSGEEDWNTLVADIGWVSTSGERYHFDNDGNVLTISIDKCMLGQDFHWALYLAIGSGFYGNPYQQLWVPDGASWGDPIVDMGIPNYMHEELTGPADLYKSEDDGYTWDETELVDADAPIVDIAVSPNYEDDETVYVGCADGTVYRLEEAGEGDVIALKTITDNDGIDASQLFSLDVWTGEDDYNWVLVGTDIDVLVLKDKRFEDWRDQELNLPGFEVAFAPDFDDSELIWAVTESGGDFLVTSTVSPGKWGQEVGEVDLSVKATPFLDIGFPDDYDSDPDTGDTNLWVAVNSPDGGDIFLIEGVDADDGDSNAIKMFTKIGGEAATDFISIAVSGDYGDEIILAGELNSPTIWISDDGGYGWSEADKSPTGEGMTYVIMEADVVWDGEVFDPDDGMAFACTAGAESAVSRANDGGQVYNQVGLIDTEIDGILDLGFSPDFPGTPTLIMLTEDTGTSYSLWLTENGDEDEPDYVRVLCAGDAGNFDATSLSLVEYAQDGDAIYITGSDDIWKSTDDGQTFGKHRTIKGTANINDWVITEDDTIYAATSKGFAKTINSGLSWSATLTTAMNDVALSPDFDGDETILLGGTDGEVYMSDDGGSSFDDTNGTTTLFEDDDVSVAFSPQYTDDALIYAAGAGDVMVGEVADTDDVDWEALEDDTNEEPVTGDFYGLVVSEDNALYAITDSATYVGVEVDKDEYIGNWEDKTGVVRLLLHESDSLWEYADGLDEPEGLWLSAGSNVLWTIDGNELWVLEDTLSGQVTLDSPPDGYQSDRLDVIQLAWDEMRGADEYQYKGTESSGLGMDIDRDETDDTSINVEVDSSCEYDWKVRVAPGEPWHSRWSDEWAFNTALGDAPWAPTLYTPGGVWQYSGLDVELMPAFSWESAKNADSYQFVLADNAEFTSPLVNQMTPESAYNLDFELEYNSNYFWRIMAYDGNKAISRWSDIGAFTTIEKAPPAPPAPAPPATVTQPAPAPVVIPTPIPPVLLWVIVGIGAALIIAVIVLIVRTRRAV